MKKEKIDILRDGQDSKRQNHKSGDLKELSIDHPIKYNPNPEIRDNGLIQINSRYYLNKIEDAINKFNRVKYRGSRDEMRNEFLNIIKELRKILESKIKLSPAQIAAIHNDMGAIFEYLNKEKSQESYMQAIKIAYRNHLEKILPVIDQNLDRVHEELDKATWILIKDKWFKEKEGSYFLDLERLKVNEINLLAFNKGEYRLLKRLCLKDDYTLEHSIRVMAISLRIAKWMRDKKIIKLSPEEMKMFAKAAALHDIGKASPDEDGKDLIPDYILKAYSQSKLSKEEFSVIKQHVVYGVKDLSKLYSQDDALAQRMIEIIIRHHRRVKGTGYPEEIMAGEEKKKIDFNPENNKDHFLAEIIAFADTIEAMTAKERSYQETQTLKMVRDKFNKEFSIGDGQKQPPIKEQYSRVMQAVFAEDEFWRCMEQEFFEINTVKKEIDKFKFTPAF